MITQEALQREGHRAVAASDGREALERLAEDEYDLIISDVRMPGMDASALLERIDRLHPELRERVLLTTGDTVRPNAEDFARERGLELVPKPFDIDELMRRVRLRLARQRGGA